MATVPPVITELDPRDGSAMLVTWTLAGTDDGAPIQMAQWADRSVQMTGTFGGGTVLFEGSNNGTDYVTLTDAQTTAISKTATPALEQVVELTRLARPRASVSVTSVVVSLLVRRQQPMRK